VRLALLTHDGERLLHLRLGRGSVIVGAASSIVRAGSARDLGTRRPWGDARETDYPTPGPCGHGVRTRRPDDRCTRAGRRSGGRMGGPLVLRPWAKYQPNW